jgi:predicted phage terminase large subunit-like protein
MAVSTGGGITGRGGDILIIDDPLKPDEALSDVIRKNVNEWFDGTAYTRLDSKRHGAIVILLQRLHLEDLVGYVQEKGGWEIINLPAIAEEDTEIEFKTIFGPQKIIRSAGTALHSEREPLETLASIRANMGEFRFSGQYQQSPVPIGGGIIKTDWIKTYELAELPPLFEMIVQSWDTASKDHQFANFSVCVTLGLKNKMIYVLDVRRSRMDYPTLKRTTLELARQYKPHAILVEDASSGIQLAQDLKEQNIYSVKPIKPQGDKQTRLFAQSGLFESGVVRVPKEARWVTDFVHEITSFPVYKFDDQVDAISQGLAYLRERLDESGWITYYRQLYIEKHGHDLIRE